MRQGLLILLMIALSASAAGARVWTVAPDGTADFLTIQDAIDAADSGDEIRVAPGRYAERIDTVGKVLDLIGVEGAETTIVDAEQLGSALTVPFTPGGTPIFRGLSFTNGSGTILRGREREGRFGGGAWIEVAVPRFEACWFVENSANNGGGVYVLSGAPEFIECRFFDNGAGHGGGIALEHDSGVHLELCEISGNQGVFGGGIELFHSRLVADRCRFVDNLAVEGGAVRLVEGGGWTATVRSSLITGNSAAEGGAVWVRDGRLDLSAVTIADNRTDPGGGSVNIASAGDLRIEASIVALSRGGELFVCEGLPPSSDCVVLWSPSIDGVICPQGETVLFSDPLFCDPGIRDFTLRTDSPCLPGQGPPGCGRIGAFEAGCDSPVGTTRISLGRVKGLFR